MLSNIRMETLGCHNSVKRTFAGLFGTLVDTGSTWIRQIIDLISDRSIIGGTQALQTDNLFFICQAQLVPYRLRTTYKLAHEKHTTRTLATLAQFIAKAGEFA